MGRFDHIRPEVAPDGPAAADEGLQGAEHWIARAEAALERGRFEPALRYFGRALEQERGREAAWAGQARALLEMDQPEEALRWLEQAARVAGEKASFLALRAIASARSGAPEDALAWADRALKEGPDQADVWLARAEVLYLQGAGTLAGTCLEKAHERAPGPATARRAAEVSLGAGDLARARTWLDRARVAAPEHPLVALRLGVWWERAGNLEMARTEFSRALALEPRLAPARLALEALDRATPLARVRALFRRLRHGG